MSWERIERRTWQMWKHDYTITRMAREISNLTHWSEYLSLCYIVDYLHNKRGIGFSRKQLRYAFSKIPKEEVEGSRTEAWAWLIHLGGYEYKRGKKSGLRHVKNSHILSSLKVKIADISISNLERYKTISEELKSSQRANFIMTYAPEREALQDKGEPLQEA